MLRGELHHEEVQLVKAAGVGFDIVAIDEAVADEDVGDAVESAMSLRGLTGRWMSAIIAVLVTRGSTTITWCAVLSAAQTIGQRWQRMGWLSAMLAPISRMTSAVSISA